MKIIQMLPSLAYGDAIGNDVIAKMNALIASGYDTEVYAGKVAEKIMGKNIHKYDPSFVPEDDDVLIYHFSTCSPMNFSVARYKCRKICVYHNITPPEFYSDFHPEMAKGLRNAYAEIKFLIDKFDHFIAVSDFNKECLVKMGCDPEKITVISCVIPFDDYNKKPDSATLKKYSDGFTNILFVGRVVPNKKIEDIINCFGYYNKNINPRSRLILVGKCIRPQYQKALEEYIDTAGIKNVIFTNSISFDSIIAVYKAAHLFLCMSEYEGLCVPLLEAMFFRLPIIAYKTAAIPYTLGGSGILVDNKDPVLVSKLMDKAVNDSEFRSAVIESQNKRLEFFSYENIAGQFIEYIKSIV